MTKQAMDPLAVAAEIGRIEAMKSQFALEAYAEEENNFRFSGKAGPAPSTLASIKALTAEQKRLEAEYNKSLEEPEPTEESA